MNLLHEINHTIPSSGNRIYKRLQIWWAWATTPTVQIEDEPSKQRNRLLAGIIILLTVLLAIILVQRTLRNPSVLQSMDHWIASTMWLSLFGLFYLNRCGRTSRAAGIIIALSLVLFVVVPFTPDSMIALIYFNAISISLTALLFNHKELYAVTAIIVLGLVGLYNLFPNTTISGANIIDALTLVTVTSGIAILSKSYQAKLEQLRFQQLHDAYDQVRASEVILEKRVEERTVELRLARDEAEKANEFKSLFLANMSHDLRHPLNAILNFSAFVSDGVAGPVTPEQRNLLENSIKSGRHLLELINDVLDITKIEAGMMELFLEPVDLGNVLRSVTSIGNGLIMNQDVKLIREIDPDLLITYGDNRRLRQIFLNLVSNAVKFTANGYVKITAIQLDGLIRVTVEDTGCGIRPEDHHLIFESFRQSKHNIANSLGTGLGMPIAKYFAELHGGKIWFESKFQQGTTFYVELPILSQEEACKIIVETPANLNQSSKHVRS